MRAVTVLATGGTIAMTGPRATPGLQARELVEAALGPARSPEVEVRDVMSLPGPHIGPAQALDIARQAVAVAGAGRGVVVTTGTDTLEELAMLTDLLHDGQAPIVFTGANRPATRPGADGPANLADAVAVAAAEEAAGLGTVVVFGGEVHAARLATKIDTTGPVAFASPASGPVGRVVDGALWLAARPRRQPSLRPSRLEARVEIVVAHLGADARLIDAAASFSDGLVAVLLGAGHAPPAFLEGLEAAAARMPVVATTRVARGGMLRDTYGFRGSEVDVRASGAIAAGLLTPAAARIKLLACLGAGLDGAAIADAFSGDDAHPG
jgi:L-asparaginase